ncbi:hypothetical protein ACIGBL_34795 [Streptomyces sp. NPDC085614]|uniref:hypothetical protein n=1 Tax=Streptomyces sp. NPDC085614 TaxID=3365733 RepID=UPI0037D83A13
MSLAAAVLTAGAVVGTAQTASALPNKDVCTPYYFGWELNGGWPATADVCIMRSGNYLQARVTFRNDTLEPMWVNANPKVNNNNNAPWQGWTYVPSGGGATYFSGPWLKDNSPNSYDRAVTDILWSKADGSFLNTISDAFSLGG